ncbi:MULTISPECIES: hypothetical protein [Serratia]|uniref:hypothetical protein n=1 Tax=Serratia TaxID=613 RepID=UPI00163D50DB|nr:hypothetical protein [Serratia liquefaciens]MBH2717042.1 hypothetical protein [Serratia marcescens]
MKKKHMYYICNLTKATNYVELALCLLDNVIPALAGAVASKPPEPQFPTAATELHLAQ